MIVHILSRYMFSRPDNARHELDLSAKVKFEITVIFLVDNAFAIHFLHRLLDRLLRTTHLSCTQCKIVQDSYLKWGALP